MLQSIANAAGFDTNDRIIRDLNPDSAVLEKLCETFSDMLMEKRIGISTFQEGQGKAGINVLGINNKVTLKKSFHCSLNS
jgi:hypothetical protein